ncbi:MAG: hypothetical protein ACE366_00145 [Bradymonadia bacterium]
MNTCTRHLITLLCTLTPLTAMAAPRNLVEADRENDASVDRGLLSSHAETLRAGEITFNSYQLFLAGLSAGVTDDLQLSGTFLLPAFEVFPFFGIFQGKYSLSRSETTSISVTANAIYTEGGFTSFGPGLSIDHHLGAVSLHGTLIVNAALGEDEFDDDREVESGFLVVADLGFTARLSKRFKLLGELKVPMLLAAGENSGFSEDLALATYGVRFHGSNLAADLAFLRPVTDYEDFVLGVPYVAFSARF